jgi:hypothetical protein
MPFCVGKCLSKLQGITFLETIALILTSIGISKLISFVAVCIIAMVGFMLKEGRK